MLKSRGGLPDRLLCDDGLRAGQRAVQFIDKGAVTRDENDRDAKMAGQRRIQPPLANFVSVEADPFENHGVGVAHGCVGGPCGCVIPDPVTFRVMSAW